MILIDANALTLLIVGLIDQSLISKHKRTSTFSKEDHDELLRIIGDFGKLVVLPNVWTETDNLLNRFTGKHKWPYIETIKSLTSQTTEEYLNSEKGANSNYFMNLGLTDSLLIELWKQKQYDFLITGDSTLSDIATANGIKVYDTVRRKNEKFLK